jgi:pyruvate, orthophosphate dikinase
MKQYVYFITEGNKDMKSILGGKGANLSEMYNLGLPVPETFTVSTDACLKYYDDNKVIAKEVQDQIWLNVKKLEQATGKVFGDKENPLLLSVRSGAVFSMPGMMDTVLNLGLSDETAAAFAEKTGKPIFVYDLYRRFIEMFADVVCGIERHDFEAIVEWYQNQKGLCGHNTVYVGRRVGEHHPVQSDLQKRNGR